VSFSLVFNGLQGGFSMLDQNVFLRSDLGANPNLTADEVIVRLDKLQDFTQTIVLTAQKKAENT
jgi:hypothetical protein